MAGRRHQPKQSGSARLTRDPTPEAAAGKPWRVTLLRALNPDGTLLWPDHNSLKQYQEIAQSGGRALFDSIWMQDPSGLAGDVFKPEWFQDYAHNSFTEEQPSATRPGRMVTLTAKDLLAEGRIQAIIPDIRELYSLEAVDLALKQKETNDFYCRGNVYAGRDGRLFVEDIFQSRLTLGGMLQDMTRAGRHYRARMIGIESVAFQALVVQLARRGSHLPFKELDTAGRDKVMRARPVAARYEGGMVYHLYGARWKQPFEFQLAAFPGGAHDDGVDVIAYLGEMAALYVPSASFQAMADAQRDIRRTGNLRDSGLAN